MHIRLKAWCFVVRNTIRISGDVLLNHDRSFYVRWNLVRSFFDRELLLLWWNVCFYLDFTNLFRACQNFWRLRRLWRFPSRVISVLFAQSLSIFWADRSVILKLNCRPWNFIDWRLWALFCFYSQLITQLVLSDTLNCKFYLWMQDRSLTTLWPKSLSLDVSSSFFDWLRRRIFWTQRSSEVVDYQLWYLFFVT